MKNQIVLLLFLLSTPLFSQEKTDSKYESVSSQNLSEEEKKELKDGLFQSHQHSTEEYIFVPEANERSGGNANTQVVPQCSNMDFETGTFQNWTRSNGYNPLFNAQGCCSLTNQLDITLMTGAGLDPFGGFPVVCPGGGSVTARIGSTTTGGRADRLEQTFSVSATNPTLKINYAAVLNDGGHTTASQPRITFEILDSLGNQIPCAFLNISLSSGLSSWFTSTLSTSVKHTNWKAFIVDLSSYMGQTLTFRATAFDCGPSGHFAYTYLDIECLSVLAGASTTVCANGNIPICSLYPSPYTAWSVPQSTVPVFQNCVTATTAGVYTCYPNGCLTTSGAAYTYTVNLEPIILLTKSIVDSVSCNSTVSFSATAMAGTSTLSGTWHFGDSTFSAGNQAIHTYTSLGNRIAFFVAQSSNGCKDSVTQLIRILPLPTAFFLSDTVCEGAALSFTNLSTVSIGSITSSAWLSTTTSFSTVAAPAQQTLSLPAGSYPFTLTVNSGNNCTASFTQSALVVPVPQASVSMQPSYCAGSVITYSYNFSPLSTSVAATSWTLPLLVSSTAPSATQIIYTAGTYTSTLLLSGQNGCASLQQSTFAVFPLPTLALVGGSICAGSIFNLIPTGAAQYTVSGNSFFVSPSISTIYTLQGSSVEGCVSANSASALVSVAPLPSLTLNSGSICIGRNFTFTPAGAATYTLSGNSTVVSPTTTSVYTLQGLSAVGCPAQSAITATVLVSPLPTIAVNSSTICAGSFYTIQATGAQQYTYSTGSPVFSVSTNSTFWVLGEDVNSCTATVQGTVTTLANPTVNLSLSTFTVCKNDAITILASGAQTYSWSTGAVSNPIFYTAQNTGVYTVSVRGQSANGCADSTQASILVYPLPSFTVTSLPKITCTGQTAVISAMGATSYSWSNGFTTSYQLIQPTQTTTFAVTGYGNYGCKTTVLFAHEVDVCESINETKNRLDGISLYPNPSFDYFSINGLLPELIYGITIYDAAGKIVYSSTISSVSPVVSLAFFAEGIYLCKLTDGSSFSVHRIVKQN